MGWHPYGCRRCDEYFNTKEDQLAHLDFEHIKCSFCKEYMDSSPAILRHEADYHNCCEDCQEVFHNYNELRQVCQITMRSPYECLLTWYSIRVYT